MPKLAHRCITIALVLLPVGGISHAMTPEAAMKLMTDVSAACDEVAQTLVPKAAAAWGYPDACTAEGEAAPCRLALVESTVQALESALDQADPKAALRSRVDPTSFEPQELLPLQVLVDRLDRAASQASETAIQGARAAADEGFAQFDPAADGVEARAKSLAAKAFEAASERFQTKCSAEALDVLSQLWALMFRPAAEEAHHDDLTKDTGFSPVVRCQWVRRQNAPDALDCKPGLRVGAQDPSTILVSAPGGGSDVRIAWVRAITAEEGFNKKPLAQLTCPGYGAKKDDKLACDTLCFAGPSSEGDCQAGHGVKQAMIAVHVPRWFGTSWGCGTMLRPGAKRCAFDRLREPDHREKLSLVVQGKSPVILIQARDSEGKLASGEVLVGYERWRFESGGFLAVTDVVDRQLVLETAEESNDAGKVDDAGKVKVVDIREKDDLAQETGIFLNLIPRNYETAGVGLGFATHDGRSPSLYAGPVVRIRTFGHRGIASLSGGYALRQVHRFPELHARFPNLLSDGSEELFSPNDAILQPELQWEGSWYVGLHLGFSFGPIGSGGQEDD